MDADASYELESIKSELRSIIAELEAISAGVRNEFAGIGNEKCADSLDGVISQYRYVARCLANIDTSKVTEEFAAAHSDA